jgi:hypothetical protein
MIFADSNARRSPNRLRTVIVCLTLAGLSLALSAITHLLPAGPRVRYDERSHHLPVITKFADELPRPNLRDYASATTPGYHLLMAVAKHVAGFEVFGLRLLTAIVTAATVAALAALTASLGDASDALLVVPPLMVNAYFVTAGARVLPDNLGWACVVLLLWSALAGPRDARRVVWAAVCGAANVLVRQSNLWTIPFVAIGAYLSDSEHTRTIRASVTRASIAAGPGIGVALAFYFAWGGLVPPSFQSGAGHGTHATAYGGWSPAGLTLCLALTGLFGFPWLVVLWAPARHRLGKSALAMAGVVAFASLVLASLPESSARFPDRRSGIWQAVAVGPTLWNRSLLLVTLASVGGVVLMVGLAAVDGQRRRILLGAAIACFACAQVANPMAWPRYYEPMILIWLACIVSSRSRDSLRVPSVGPSALRFAAAAVAVLVLQLASSAIALSGYKEQESHPVSRAFSGSNYEAASREVSCSQARAGVGT